MLDAGAARYMAWQRSLPMDKRETTDRFCVESAYKVAALIDEYCDALIINRTKPLEVRAIQAIGSDVAALIGIKTAFRLLSIEAIPRGAFCLSVGVACMNEMRAQWIRKERPKEWALLENLWKERDSAKRGEETRRILRQFDDEAPSWDLKVRRAVGRLVYLGMRKSTMLSVRSYRNMGCDKKETQTRISLDLLTKASAVIGATAEISPVRMPMFARPLDWAEARGGGYYHWKLQKPLIAKTTPEQQAILSQVPPRRYIEAANRVQRIAWRVDERILRVARELFLTGNEVAGIAPQSPQETAPYAKPHDPLKHRKRNAWNITTTLNNRIRRMRLANLLFIAQTCTGRDIYFPVHFCFRGRMYSSAYEFNWQGHNMAKGILKFAKGVPIVTDSDERALAFHGAGCFGKLFLTGDERCQWIHENSERLAQICADPTGNDFAFWGECDRPFEALAFCYEWTEYKKHGRGFVSTLPCRVDATASAAQLTALLSRDERLASACNLTPADRPIDYYAIVAEKVSKRMADDTQGYGKRWLEFLGGSVTRDDVKKLAIVYLHGGTTYGLTKEIGSFLKEKSRVCRVHPFHYDEYLGAIGVFRRAMVSAVTSITQATEGLHAWMQDCAAISAMDGRPLTWKTREGLVVEHNYKQEGVKAVRAATISLKNIKSPAEPKDGFGVSKQRQAIVANVIHSMDGAMVVRTVLGAGVDVAPTFDGFTTHASHLAKVISVARSALLATGEGDPMMDLYRGFCLRAPKANIPQPPFPGRFDPESARDSKYSFT